MPRRQTNRFGELKVFARVVEHGSFSDAARALKMTPSAVSRSIARLETRLGAPLFERTTRHIELNADGEYFHRRITRILADVEEVERSIIRLATSDHG